MGMAIKRSAHVNKDIAKENASRYEKGLVTRNDRRKNKQDRRKSVRDGVYVSLSFKKDRRVLKDRRKPHPSN